MSYQCPTSILFHSYLQGQERHQVGEWLKWKISCLASARPEFKPRYCQKRKYTYVTAENHIPDCPSTQVLSQGRRLVPARILKTCSPALGSGHSKAGALVTKAGSQCVGDGKDHHETDHQQQGSSIPHPASGSSTANCLSLLRHGVVTYNKLHKADLLQRGSK
jgi:hypothetical protein